MKKAINHLFEYTILTVIVFVLWYFLWQLMISIDKLGHERNEILKDMSTTLEKIDKDLVSK